MSDDGKQMSVEECFSTLQRHITAATLYAADEQLRDQFATAALTGILSNPAIDACEFDEWASDAYRLADAMMRAREATKALARKEGEDADS